MSDTIRPATSEDLRWLDNGFDEETMRRDAEEEIRRALTATPTPRHWSQEDSDERLD